MPATPWTIVVDTAEQLPWDFAAQVAAPPRAGRIPAARIVRGNLWTGDYTVQGLHGSVLIDRKSQADFYSTVVHQRRRWEDCLGRLNSCGAAWVIVEASWADLIRDAPRFTDAPPRSLFASVIAWRNRFPGVHWLDAPGRDAAQAMGYRILERAWVEQLRRAKRHVK